MGEFPFTDREMELAAKWRNRKPGSLCIEELLAEYRADFERQLACKHDRTRVLAERLTARDEHCDALTAERDQLRFDLATQTSLRGAAEDLRMLEAVTSGARIAELEAERDQLRARVAELEARNAKLSERLRDAQGELRAWQGSR